MVIVDYYITDECPAIGEERYTGALLLRHAIYPRDAEILVCADQRVPKGWRRLADPVEDPNLHLLCQSSLNDRPIAERVMRIRRQ
jgi:hypothetical protein